MKRRVAINRFFIFWLSVFIVFGAAHASAQKLRVAYTAFAGTFTVLWVGKDAGLYQKHGVDMELLFIGSSTKAVQALLGGDIDIVYSAAGAVVDANLAGADLTLIGCQYDTGQTSFFTTAPIATVSGLKGKAVGVSRFGAFSDFVARHVLTKNRLQPIKDVALLQLGGTPEIIAGMQKNLVQGGAISLPLGLFDHMQKHDLPARSYVDLYRSHLEVIAFADQAGMDFYFVAEHHFDLGFSECPSPGAFLGAASQRTTRIRLGPLVYVLPLWNPIRVAEEVALLDNLTEGRLECGFGAGIGPFSFAAYNIPWEQKREMTLEALQIIRGLWTREAFSFEGRYFKCKDVDLSIPLVQKPHPPLWMPTRSKESIEEAAGSAISTVQWVPAGMKAARRAFDEYRAAYQRTQPSGPKPHIGLMREIYVAETDRQARTEGEYHWKNFWERRGGARTYGAHGSTGLSTILDGGRRPELMDMEHSIAEGSFICGAPDTVVEQIKKIALDAGADTFLGEFTFGELTQKQALNSLNLFAEHVMPELRNFEIDALNYPKADM